ncbi:MAG: hypothetical protein GXX08_08380 [Firmicutes bacterium]|nr:hypothetical protein [Bacillota bacterium]
MIQLDEITKAIIAGLKEYLAAYDIKQVIEADQPDPRPAYPFVTFKWLPMTPDGSAQPTRIVSVVPSSDERFESDVQYTYVRNPTLNLSISVYDKARSDQIAMRAMAVRDWFEVHELGNDWLEPLNAVITNATGIQDRDTILDRGVERRQGFDVSIRVIDTVEVRVPTIEKVKITGPEGTKEIDL